MRERRQGMIPARNAGFNKTENEIIAKCDADTVLPSNWIKNIKTNFSQDSSLVGISMPINLNDVNLVGRSTFLFYIYMLIPRLIIGVYPMVGPSYAIRKTVGKIFHDKKTIVSSSARRIITNPLSFFGEYNIRFFKMLYSHRYLA